MILPEGTDTVLCTESRPLACCDSPFIEVFAGFTTATFDGAQGGRAEANFSCGQEFPGSHLCHAAEYYRSQTTTPPPVDGAWLDTSAFFKSSSSGVYSTSTCAAEEAGIYTGAGQYQNCGGWTINTSPYNYYGTVILADGTDTVDCEEFRSLACCE